MIINDYRPSLTAYSKEHKPVFPVAPNITTFILKRRLNLTVLPYKLVSLRGNDF